MDVERGGRIRRHRKSDNMWDFVCDDDDLEDFIRDDAGFYEDERIAFSYVLEMDKKCIAYFSLANDCISLENFVNVTEFNRFRRRRFANSKRIKGYPAVNICRLAVGNSMKGNGVGTFLMDFIKMYLLKKGISACRFITVDANVNAISFYVKNGFTLISEDVNPAAKTIPMFFGLAEIFRTGIRD